MLNHQLILVDPEGRLRCTLEAPPPDAFNGGTPVKDGLLCIVDIGGVYFVNGLGYGPESRVCYEQAVNPSVGDPFVSGQGRLRAVDGIPAFWLYGLPFSVDGQLCLVVDGAPAPEVGAFSSAFSSAFD